MATVNWTKDQVKLAFHLYCQLPFGKLHSRNPDIVELASLIGRTPSAVAMKCTNLASLDPAITGSGRRGLTSASAIDREVWGEFHSNWEKLAFDCEAQLARLRASAGKDALREDDNTEQDYEGATRKAIVEVRIKQAFFRRAVFSSYNNRCCMTGISEPKLLLASHIVPWSEDKANRLNPRNGLCLSALHDRAFDRGLISLTDDLRIIVSDALKKRRKEKFIASSMIALEGKQITLPEKFTPDLAFVQWHRWKFINL